MAEFRPLVVSLLVFGLFAVLLINIGAQIAQDNNPNSTILNISGFSNFKANTSEHLEDSYGTISDADTAVTNSSVTLTSGIPFVDAIGGIWKTIKVAPMAIYGLVKDTAVAQIIGDNTVIVATVGAILLLTFIFAVWKFISTGEGG